jgi:hypothetical protein
MVRSGRPGSLDSLRRSSRSSGRTGRSAGPDGPGCCLTLVIWPASASSCSAQVMLGSRHGRHRTVTGDPAAEVAGSPGLACAVAGRLAPRLGRGLFAGPSACVQTLVPPGRWGLGGGPSGVRCCSPLDDSAGTFLGIEGCRAMRGSVPAPGGGSG